MFAASAPHPVPTPPPCPLRVTLVSGSDPATLLRAAAAPLLMEGRPPEPLPLIAVRQGGLRDEIHHLACRAGSIGWLGKPVVVFAELPAAIAGPMAPLDELERRALIHRVLAAAPPATLPLHARRTLVESLDRLFGDLCADEVDPDRLAASLAMLGGDTWERGRNADVVRLHAAYRAALGSLPRVAGLARTDGRDGLALAAHAVRVTPDAVRQRLRRPFDAAATARALHVYGLADLRRGWRTLLDALRASDVVTEIRIHLPDPAPDADIRDDALRAWLDAHADAHERVEAGDDVDPALAHLRKTLFAMGAAVAGRTNHVTATAAPDITRELDAVARAVKRLIVDEGVPPAEIAVVARKARPYLMRAASALGAHGIPVHARLRHTLSDVPAVRALLRALRAPAGGWRLGELEALDASPYFDVALDRDVMRLALRVGHPRGLAAWATALDDLRRTVAVAGAAAEDDALPPLWRVDAAIERFARFAAAASMLDLRRTASDWIAATRAMIGAADGTGFLDFATLAAPALADDAPTGMRDALRLDAAALLHLLDILSEWNAAVSLEPDAGAMLDASQWAAELEDVLEDREITLRAGAHGGVHLLEALAAEGRSFAHVFVVGLESGAFPADPAPDTLFADDECRRLAAAGLPVEPSVVWLEREATLFRGLVLAARRTLHLSWSYADADGAPQLASAFAEDVIARFIDADASPAEAQRAWQRRIPASAVVATDPGEVWSASEALRLAARQLRRGEDAGGLLAVAAAEPATNAALEQLLHAAEVEQVRVAARASDPSGRMDLAHAWNGDVTGEGALAHLAARYSDRVWSATQLEKFGRCPFSFLASHALGVRSAGEVDPDDADARDVGSARHAALARIYPRLVAEFGTEVFATADITRVAAIVHEEVARAIEAQGGGWTRLEGLRKARVQELTDELTRYIEWEMGTVKVPRVPLATELAFGMEDGGRPPVTITAPDGRTVRLRGQVDRVDAVLPNGVDEGWRYVVDHKSGGAALADITQLRPEGAVLQLALYLRALREVEPGAKVWGGVYQLVRSHKRVGALERCSVVKAGPKVLGTDTQKKHDATIEASATVAADIVDGVLAGRFPARTPGTTDCMAYCDFRDVCREERLEPKSW